MNAEVIRAFAVSPTPLPRDAAYSPNSSQWTLYDPKALAEKLGMPVDVVDRALIETGFNKAIRQREELIRWKARLRKEEVALQGELMEINQRKRMIGQRLTAIREQLINVRNILRLPREAA